MAQRSLKKIKRSPSKVKKIFGVKPAAPELNPTHERDFNRLLDDAIVPPKKQK